MTQQRVRVIGADNFVGRRVLAALRATGAAAAIDGSGDAASFAPALDGADAIVNCSIGAPASILATARRLFAAAARLGTPLRIVHLSSMTVYGTATGRIAEDGALLGDLGEYSAAQVASEKLAAAYPRAVILRPGCEYGPDCAQWSRRVARWLLARRLGDLGEAGVARCNLIHIDDLVAAVLAALTRPGVEGEAFNLADAASPSWNRYFAAYAQALGALPLRQVSAARLRLETRLFAPPLKVAEIVARRFGLDPDRLPPAIPPSLLQLCRQDIRLDVSKAETLLGLRWTPLAEGLRAAASEFHPGN